MELPVVQQSQCGSQKHLPQISQGVKKNLVKKPGGKVDSSANRRFTRWNSMVKTSLTCYSGGPFLSLDHPHANLYFSDHWLLRGNPQAHHCDLLAVVAQSLTMAAKKGAEALAGTVNKSKVTIATGEVGCEEWMEVAELESRKQSWVSPQTTDLQLACV